VHCHARKCLNSQDCSTLHTMSRFLRSVAAAAAQALSQLTETDLRIIERSSHVPIVPAHKMRMLVASSDLRQVGIYCCEATMEHQLALAAAHLLPAWYCSTCQLLQAPCAHGTHATSTVT
jgi:hypothetical protein